MLVDPSDRGLASQALARGVFVFIFSCSGVGCATKSPRQARDSRPDPSSTAAIVQATPPPASEQRSDDSPEVDDADEANVQDVKAGSAPDLAPPPVGASEPPAAPTEEPVASDPPLDTASVLPDWLHGSFAVRYRGRTNGDDADHDLGGFLALDFADPATSRISGHLQARFDADLDGHDDGSVFGSLDDTYDQAIVSKLYLAYADISLTERPENSPGLLRVGRMSDPRLPEVVRLDGLAYATRPMGKHEVELGAYAGIPVHLYESSNDGDQAFGTFVEGRPWKDGRARIDWMHLEDEDVLGEGENDLVALGLWQELSERWRLEGTYSHLEGNPRDLRLRALYGNPESGNVLRFGYYELLEPQKSLVTELDPFYEQLLEYQPFRQGNVSTSHPLGDHTVLDLGFDMRRVDDSGDVGEFNREWERYYATVTRSDLGKEGLALALTADLWDDDDRDINSFGADLSYDPEQRWKASVGTYYSLYKYVFLELDEREDVRTYYLRTTYDLTKSAALELLYEYEDDDFDGYHTLRLGARWRF